MKMVGIYVGKALMSIKASFSNVVNVLLDWDDVHNDDICSWRGVFCDNVSLSVLTLYAHSFVFLTLLLWWVTEIFFFVCHL